MKNSAMVLFVCSGLLLSGGGILGVSTLWSTMRMSYYFWTSDLGIELGSSVLFMSGALLCLPACWLATLVPYHPRSTSLLATLMILVSGGMMLLSMGMTSITGLSRAVREPALLNSSMLRSMAYEAVDPAVKSAFSSMQLELKCCGVKSHADWYKYGAFLPPSCCGRVWNGRNANTCEVPLHTAGCLRPALAELRIFANSVAVLACAIIIVKAVTLFATAYTLVTGVIERAADGYKPSPQPLRIACLTSPFSPLALPTPASQPRVGVNAV
ncbi:CD63 antigen-like [Bicyclus anynana]|uniref:CD63 antigen-like n=1 Tax=Bicyclus anynana TaxID=110368 RepID=A0A6J1NGC6_BICAN|nr:CD63 antigen-like [Bicyclus anynana]